MYEMFILIVYLSLFVLQNNVAIIVFFLYHIISYFLKDHFTPVKRMDRYPRREVMYLDLSWIHLSHFKQTFSLLMFHYVVLQETMFGSYL